MGGGKRGGTIGGSSLGGICGGIGGSRELEGVAWVMGGSVLIDSCSLNWTCNSSSMWSVASTGPLQTQEGGRVCV